MFSGDIFMVLEFSFLMGLFLICTHQGYLTRKVTHSAHGLRYVFFGSFAALLNSVLTVIIYLSMGDNNKELVFSVHYTFFATTAFVCMFIPKIEIFVFHPEKDTLFDALALNNGWTTKEIPFKKIRRNQSSHNDTTPAPPL